MYVLLILLLVSSCNGQSTTVNTKHGPVEGHMVDLGNGQSVFSFLAIRYARAPIESLRFRPPEEPEPWTDVFVADTLGNACPQSGGTLDITHPDYDRIDEDCLNLNIFTPRNYREPGPYPVHVFIHGGSYSGSANIQYPGHFYAARGVIMVMANYRLGKLGFMSSGDSVAPGNWGILDQILALRFVQENIRNFGGDPDAVTVSGHSAGGGSIGVMQLSPMAQGLFQQIFFMSGSDMAGFATNSLAAAANYTRQVAREVNCTIENSQAMMECLREVPAEDLVDAGFIGGYPGDTSLGFTPTVGATPGILPDTPANLRESGNFHRMPVMIGKTDREVGTGFVIMEDGLNSTEFRDFIQTTAEVALGDLGEATVEDVAKAAIFQFSPWPHIENRISNRERIMDAAEDLSFGVSTDQVVKAHARLNLPTYEYVFGYRTPLMDMFLPAFTGVFHMLDMGWVFGHVLTSESPDVGEDMEIEFFSLLNYTESDIQYAYYWVDLLANFVKYGDPTPTPHPAPGGKPPTDWKPFTMEEPNYLNVRNESIEVIVGRRQRDNAFWTDYIPWLVSKNVPTRKLKGSPLKLVRDYDFDDLLNGYWLKELPNTPYI